MTDAVGVPGGAQGVASAVDGDTNAAPPKPQSDNANGVRHTSLGRQAQDHGAPKNEEAPKARVAGSCVPVKTSGSIAWACFGC